MKKRRVVGYARVSTMLQIAGKDFDSIDAQTEIIKAYVANHPEMELIQIFTDPGKSGKNLARPGIQALLQRIRQGDIDCVLSYRLDRISRDHFDYFEFERTIMDNGVQVIYTNDMNPDNSPLGQFMRMLMVALAQLERNQTIQRINDKHTALLKQGFHAGGYAPVGYLLGEKKNTLVVDPVASKHVKEMYSLLLKGTKPSAIATHMYNKYGTVPKRKTRNGREYGGNVYCENFIRRVLANPVYAGYVHRKGTELYKGLHEPLVSAKNWEKAQEILKVPRERKIPEIRSGKNLYVLKSKLYCGCGAMMTCGASGKPKKDGSFTYYICSARNHKRIGHRCKSSMSSKILEAIVFSALGHIATQTFTLKEIKESSDSYEAKILKERKELAVQRKIQNEKLKSIVAKFAEFDGNEVVKSAINAQIQKVSREVERLDKAIATIDEELKLLENKVNLGTAQTKAFLENMDALQAEISDAEKRAIVESAISKVTLIVKSVNGFRREFELTIIPTAEYMEQIGVLTLEFAVNTSNGYSEWKIKSPFVLTSETYGKRQPKKTRKQKKHWLHKVVSWQRVLNAGDSLEDITNREGVSKPLVCRKLKLLERLHFRIIERILKERYADVNEKLTFRYLCKLATLPQNQQLIQCSFLA